MAWKVVDAMRQTVTNMMGTLPPQFFAVTVTTVCAFVVKLCTFLWILMPLLYHGHALELKPGSLLILSVHWLLLRLLKILRSLCIVLWWRDICSEMHSSDWRCNKACNWLLFLILKHRRKLWVFFFIAFSPFLLFHIQLWSRGNISAEILQTCMSTHIIFSDMIFKKTSWLHTVGWS